MKAVLAVIPIVALVIIGIVVGAFVFKTRDTLRYRMTVEIDAPDGPVAGTSVIESTIGKRLPWADSGVFFELRGEAVLVRLRDGRVVFALLRSKGRYDPPGYHAALVPEAMRSLAEYRHDVAGTVGRNFPKNEILLRRIANRNGESIELPAHLWPMLVSFREPNDQSSVFSIDPNASEATLGAGFRVRRITVQPTNDGVTVGKVTAALPWLATLRGQLVAGRFPRPETPEQDLIGSAFVMNVER